MGKSVLGFYWKQSLVFGEFLILLLIDNFIKESEGEGMVRSLIGLSLSFCIHQICRGVVSEGQIKKIITGTCCRNRTAWKKLIASYKKDYWSKFPNEAEEILIRLRKDGRIEQPRLADDEHYPVLDHKNVLYWVNDESEILWSDSVKRTQSSFIDKINEIVDFEVQRRLLNQ